MAVDAPLERKQHTPAAFAAQQWAWQQREPSSSRQTPWVLAASCLLPASALQEFSWGWEPAWRPRSLTARALANEAAPDRSGGFGLAWAEIVPLERVPETEAPPERPQELEAVLERVPDLLSQGQR